MTISVTPLTINVNDATAQTPARISPLSRVLTRFRALDQFKRTSPKRNESKATRDSMWINKMIQGSGYKLDDTATRSLVGRLLTEPLVQSSLSPAVRARAVHAPVVAKARPKQLQKPPASVPARLARPSFAAKQVRPSGSYLSRFRTSPPKYAHGRCPRRAAPTDVDVTDTATASCSSSASTASSPCAVPDRPAYAERPTMHHAPDQLDSFMSLCAQQRRYAIGASQQPPACCHESPFNRVPPPNHSERRAWPTPRSKRPVGGFIGSQRDTTAYHREVLESDALDQFLAQVVL